MFVSELLPHGREGLLSGCCVPIPAPHPAAWLNAPRRKHLPGRHDRFRLLREKGEKPGIEPGGGH